MTTKIVSFPLQSLAKIINEPCKKFYEYTHLDKRAESCLLIYGNKYFVDYKKACFQHKNQPDVVI